MERQAAELDWTAEGVPVSRRFDDPYFSLQDGLAETRHVFLGGCDLPARFRDGFAVAELGLGSGLNLLALMRAWAGAGAPGRLTYTGFEAFPMTRAEAARVHAAFPEMAPESARLLAAWEGLVAGIGSGEAADLGDGIGARVIRGDARRTLPDWPGPADAWFLDGFAPARNPELWEAGLMRQVAARLAPGGRLATYSAAGHVRRSLAEAGLQVERRPGYGRKRHMTVAWR
ncbi:tRNA (5-methylaminomethyl-2-thiouridine)(34)-methyltransferase MnmD [Wenxinia saemankumensis]|uniref:tRNA U34 5-methylaminomethyl-2-thiouridine-forming methyltransferase MnmC n=1 Tax=Wenxinia saemankumensis TaxID=1447782 RepID=A0A1M6EQI7_9RHOB|nr:tRNA (5-methylaminomethyl-2-thiouridine)(34)-methyltransferase MnmD [Wenxinia saemankumensis]SHI87638.1 tRNA U34 5-methylaminomethyl-2-thiouridine-forming methyltransferase MnmC [Wenxinia saemankumensis]